MILESYSKTGSVIDPKRKGKKAAPDFHVSDPELQKYLELQWHKSRLAKKEKRQRELLRQQRHLHHNNVGFLDLGQKYETHMTTEQVLQETDLFVKNGNQHSLTFPPMNKHKRKLCKCLYSSLLSWVVVIC